MTPPVYDPTKRDPSLRPEPFDPAACAAAVLPLRDPRRSYHQCRLRQRLAVGADGRVWCGLHREKDA